MTLLKNDKKKTKNNRWKYNILIILDQLIKIRKAVMQLNIISKLNQKANK